MLHAPLISFFSILSPDQYWVWSTKCNGNFKRFETWTNLHFLHREQRKTRKLEGVNNGVVNKQWICLSNILCAVTHVPVYKTPCMLSHTSLFIKHPVCCHTRPCLSNILCAVTHVPVYKHPVCCLTRPCLSIILCAVTHVPVYQTSCVLSHMSLFIKHPVCCHTRLCLQNTLYAVSLVPVYKHPVCCHTRPCLQNTLYAVTYVPVYKTSCMLSHTSLFTKHHVCCHLRPCCFAVWTFSFS